MQWTHLKRSPGALSDLPPQRARVYRLLAATGLALAMMVAAASCTTVSGSAAPADEPEGAGAGSRYTIDASEADVLFLGTDGRYRLAVARGEGAEDEGDRERPAVPGERDDPGQSDAGFGEVEVVARSIDGLTVTLQSAAVWSFDGAELAVAVRLGSGATVDHVVVVGIPGQVERIVWRDGGFSPFFLGWEPDGRRLAILSGPTDGDGALRLDVVDAAVPEIAGSGADSGGPPPSVTVAGGAPLYFDWTSDGLITNVAGRLSRVRLARDASEPVIEELALRPGLFQAPSVTGTVGDFAAVLIGSDGQQIALVDGGDTARSLAGAPVGASLAMHPGGRWLAALRYGGASRIGVLDVIDTREIPAFVSRDAQVMRVSLGERRPDALPVQAAGRIGAALTAEWTPDGRTLLVLSPAPADGGRTSSSRLQWLALSHDGSQWRARPLVTFRPTPTFLQTILPYYDQHARVGSRIAPDSGAFTFAALNDAGNVGVFVYDLANDALRQISVGVTPLWRPSRRQP